MKSGPNNAMWSLDVLDLRTFRLSQVGRCRGLQGVEALERHQARDWPGGPGPSQGLARRPSPASALRAQIIKNDPNQVQNRRFELKISPEACQDRSGAFRTGPATKKVKKSGRAAPWVWSGWAKASNRFGKPSHNRVPRLLLLLEANMKFIIAHLNNATSLPAAICGSRTLFIGGVEKDPPHMAHLDLTHVTGIMSHISDFTTNEIIGMPGGAL